MRRDPLELADDSLFIEYFNQAFAAAEAFLPTMDHRFSKRKAGGFDSTPFQAANPVLGRDADEITIAGAPKFPLFCKTFPIPVGVEKHFGRTITAMIQDLKDPFI
jgi:hypothetical protein